jgi:hypothetical protein
MGFFRRSTATFDQPSSDEEWLSAGYRKYDRDPAAHQGSPYSLAAAGWRALEKGDTAKAVFFFGDAIDRMNTWSSPSSTTGWSASEADFEIIDTYISLVDDIVQSHPSASISGRHYNNDATYSVQMLLGIAGRVSNPQPFRERIDRLMAVASIEPWR